MRVSILCIGNELLLDDGVGPAAARYIETRYALPDQVNVANCACMGMAVISDLRDCDYALVLDAVDVPDARSGQLFSFDPDDAALTPPGATSLHDMRFADVLHSASLLGIESGGHCFGIQVENRSPSEFVVGLMPRVAAAVPFLTQAAIRYLVQKLGVGGVIDLAATLDPYRAGRGYRGERDFSKSGVRDEGADISKGEIGAWRAPSLPDTYGEPTAEVSAEYLVASLAAIGIQSRVEPVYGVGNRIAVALDLGPTNAVSDVAERFGLELYDAHRADSGAQYLAFVGPETTDYDLDALIGACFSLTEAHL